MLNFIWRRRRQPARGEVILLVRNWGRGKFRFKYTLLVDEVLVGSKSVMRRGFHIAGRAAIDLMACCDPQVGQRYRASFKMDEWGNRTFTILGLKE